MLPKISGVEVTPSITSVESSEQFWRKIRQIWHISEPCVLHKIIVMLVTQGLPSSSLSCPVAEVQS